MPCDTTCRCTSASCAWRTSRAPSGPSTRSSTTAGGRRGGRRPRPPRPPLSQGKGTPELWRYHPKLCAISTGSNLVSPSEFSVSNFLTHSGDIPGFFIPSDLCMPQTNFRLPYLYLFSSAASVRSGRGCATSATAVPISPGRNVNLSSPFSLSRAYQTRTAVVIPTGFLSVIIPFPLVSSLDFEILVIGLVNFALVNLLCVHMPHAQDKIGTIHS